MTCEYRAPALLPENEDIWAVWALAGRQWRSGGMGWFALDWPAVQRCATWVGVDVRVPRVRAGLSRLESETLKRQAETAKHGHK